jgi:hypothetical protein
MMPVTAITTFLPMEERRKAAALHNRSGARAGAESCLIGAFTARNRNQARQLYQAGPASRAGEIGEPGA